MTGVVDYHTPPYTAPEVLEHHRSSTSSDVWSLGCVFLDMVVSDKKPPTLRKACLT